MLLSAHTHTHVVQVRRWRSVRVTEEVDMRADLIRVAASPERRFTSGGLNEPPLVSALRVFVGVEPESVCDVSTPTPSFCLQRGHTSAHLSEQVVFGLSFTTQSPPCALRKALLAVSEGFAVSVFLPVKRERGFCFKHLLEKYAHM